MLIKESNTPDKKRYESVRTYLDLMMMHRVTIEYAVNGIMKLYNESDPEKVILPAIRRAKQYMISADLCATDIDAAYKKGK